MSRWDATTLEHVRAIKLHPRLAPEDTRDHYTEALVGTLSACFRTLFSDTNEPIAVVGILPWWSGVAMGVTLLSEEALTDYSVTLSRGTLRRLLYVAERDVLRRIQTTVSCESPEAIRWAEFLGFEPEGRLRCYHPDGSDALMMARLFD